jgi:hypothetical protein
MYVVTPNIWLDPSFRRGRCVLSMHVLFAARDCPYPPSLEFAHLKRTGDRLKHYIGGELRMSHGQLVLGPGDSKIF